MIRDQVDGEPPRRTLDHLERGQNLGTTLGLQGRGRNLAMTLDPLVVSVLILGMTIKEVDQLFSVLTRNRLLLGEKSSEKGRDHTPLSLQLKR